MAAPWLAFALRRDGLQVVEQPGWTSRGTGGIFTPIGVLAHHTAGGARGDLPSLGTVRDGRAGLPGPLSQLMLSRSGVFHCIAAGRANHAGIGSARFVPNADGNRYLIGIEAESVGTVDDWTAAQRIAYPKGVAALCRYMKVSEANVIGHKEWAPTRKVDPAFWNMNDFRMVVRAFLNNNATENGFMADLTEAEQRVVLEAANSVLFGKAGERGAGALAGAVGDVSNRLAGVEKAVADLIAKLGGGPAPEKPAA